MITIEVGQVWQDNDPRQKRYVKIAITRVGSKYVWIRRCTEFGAYDIASRRRTRTAIGRFGKRGRIGFTLVSDVCVGCGCPVAPSCNLCGECSCLDDCAP